MSSVERQLHDYFDAGVERITVEDVMAQTAVRETRLEPLRPRRSFQPAWVAVGAFAATIVAIGGVVGLIAAVQQLGGDFGAESVEIVGATGGTVGVWLIAGFAAALVAAAAAWIVRRASKESEREESEREEPDQRKVMVMETIEQADSDTTLQTKQQSRWPTIMAAILAVAVVGLVAWMVFAMRFNSPNAAPAEIQQLMEDYNAAFNAYDADALEALVADNYRIYGPEAGSVDLDMEGVRNNLMPELAGWDWQITSPDPVYAVSDGGILWYVSTEGATITRSGLVRTQNGVLTVVDSNGGFLVSEHFMMGG